MAWLWVTSMVFSVSRSGQLLAWMHSTPPGLPSVVPPLPRRPRSHRKPRPRRSRTWWHLFGYALATLTGALAGALSQHLAPFLP